MSANPLVATGRDPVKVVTQSEELSDGVGLSYPPFSLLMLNVSSLTTLGFSPLLGSKCWVVAPCMTDKSTLENLFHIPRKYSP